MPKPAPADGKEIWRRLDGFDLYEFSSRGRVRRAIPGKRTRVGNILKPYSSSSGPVVRMPGLPAKYRPGARTESTQVGVARLIAYAFHGMPENPFAAVGVRDGDRCNVSAENLFWYVPAPPRRKPKRFFSVDDAAHLGD